MQPRFSEIALALSIGLACQAASAQNVGGTVTVTQQGNGNTSYAEQYAVPTANTGTQLTITQIGDNNHAGGPGSRPATATMRVAPVPGARLYKRDSLGTPTLFTSTITAAATSPASPRPAL
jgi:hypothetical protein